MYIVFNWDRNYCDDGFDVKKGIVGKVYEVGVDIGMHSVDALKKEGAVQNATTNQVFDYIDQKQNNILEPWEVQKKMMDVIFGAFSGGPKND